MHWASYLQTFLRNIQCTLNLYFILFYFSPSPFTFISPLPSSTSTHSFPLPQSAHVVCVREFFLGFFFFFLFCSINLKPFYSNNCLGKFLLMASFPCVWAICYYFFKCFSTFLLKIRHFKWCTVTTLDITFSPLPKVWYWWSWFLFCLFNDFWTEKSTFVVVL